MKIREIADTFSIEFVGDGDVEIERVAELATASKGEIAFAENAETAGASNADCVIVPMNVEALPGRSALRSANPKLSFALVAEKLHPSKARRPQIHPTAIIADSSVIGEDVFIGAYTCVGERTKIGRGTALRAFVKVGDDVSVGENCVLDPNVFIEDSCTIGNKVVLHSGVVIGTDGFGFVRAPDRYVKFPQIGTVVIEDNVEIGAHTCVDRGALGETRIGEGTKIDNLVQIAHNVQIGKRVVIAAQTGISGSTVIEDDCVIGGQVGMGDHARVQSGAIIGSQAGVLPGKIVRPGIWWGTPVQPLAEYKRQNAMVKGLSRIREQIKDIQVKLASERTDE